MEKECARCGKAFESKRETKKFCSETCKQYAYLIRHGLDIQRLRIVNNVIDGIGTTDNNTIKQAHTNMEEKIIFKRPLIIKLIEDDLNNQHHLDSMIAHPDSYWDKDKALIVKWFNMRLKCILHNLIKLSYKEKVFPATLSALSEALVQMLRSTNINFCRKIIPTSFLYNNLPEK